jgi:hypothetical protein
LLDSDGDDIGAAAPVPPRRRSGGETKTTPCGVGTRLDSDIHDADPAALTCCRGSLPTAVNFYRSCVGLGWLAHETTGFILVRASEE